MPIELPPQVAVHALAPRPAGFGSAPLLSLQDPQQPLRIPQTDIFVEVIGEVPIRTKLADVSRLLAQRHKTGSLYRTYPPPILELIMLVKRNPARPTGRPWTSIRQLTIGYNHETSEVIMEYCLDYCTPDPETNAPHPRRKMASYSAPEEVVVKRLNKKLGDLKKYSERFD